MKRFAVVLAVAVIYLAGSNEVSFAQHKDHDAKEKTATKASSVFTCPMHPEVVSNKPGKCPKCRMNLEKQTSVKSGKVEQMDYSCPMHSDVTSAKPGKCPKCGMNLVLSDDPSMKISKARTLLNDAKRELARKGKYGCCIEDACDECALSHQSCPCAANLKAGKEVCAQCYGGWQRGEGKVSGVDPKDVKLGHGHKH